MKVLLVEDDLITRRLLTKLIADHGHEVTAFGDAEKAWDAYQSGFYPMLVLDWMLPGMSGLDLCRNVRSVPNGRYSVVLVVTALTQPGHLEAVLEAGADDYLAKPIERELMNVRLAVAERRVQNILAHKQAEEQLRLLAAGIRSSKEGILITNTNLQPPGPEVVFANESMAVMTGYTTDELVGKAVGILEGPETNVDVFSRMRRTLMQSKPFSAELVLYRKDGEPYVVRWHIAPVRDEMNAITHFVSVQQEITEQRRLERELVEISEREQRRIGRDLHDMLGQQLTGLAFMARTLERKLQDQDEMVAKLSTDLAELVDDAKTQARNLSRGLVTVDFKGGGIVLALEELATNTELFTQIGCTVQCDAGVTVSDETVATHLYRIGQEALNNAVKHSKATHVWIALYREGDQLILSVRDNGSGINVTPEERAGMGLRIMEFRAQMINATLSIRRAAEGGTLVLCSLVHSGLLSDSMNGSPSSLPQVEADS